MKAIIHELASILSSAKHFGDFYSTGQQEAVIPNVEIEGIGRIAFPLLPTQAEQVIALASRSPFGRGEDTIVDTNVRRTWQIAPDKVSLTGRFWSNSLDAIVEKVAIGLGVTSAVSAEFYKLLIYDEGCFFVEHRDTEKSAGMFATLVVTLPSLCEGGELVVRHGTQEVSLDLNNADLECIPFAAFYADCVHEVRPVTSGVRLTLIYNLLHKSKGKIPNFTKPEAETEALTSLLQRWPATATDKLIFPLAHAYTPAEFAFNTLKNVDAAAASLLVAAAETAACDVHLALVSIEETGSAEEVNYSSRRRRWQYQRYQDEQVGDEYERDSVDGGDFEIGEVFERALIISNWRSSAGNYVAINQLDFFEEELCPLNAFEKIKPDKQYFHEATGNEGATFERTYRRAALVIWPRANRLKIINGGGLDASLPYLKDLVNRWREESESYESPLRLEAQELSALIIANWPEPRPHSGIGFASSYKEMLTCLTQLKDVEHIEAMLFLMSKPWGYEASAKEAVVRAAALIVDVESAAKYFKAIITANALALPEPCAQLLSHAAVKPSLQIPANLMLPAAELLVATIVGERNLPISTNPRENWRQPAAFEQGLVVDVLIALRQLRATALAERFVNHIVSSPKAFGWDACLVPAALKLFQNKHAKNDQAMQSLIGACRNHLKNRIALPLAPPANFSRNDGITCRCQYCGELSDFLVDATRHEWVLKAAEHSRSHVMYSIRDGLSDLDVVTVKKGSPHSLVATKNQASYERRVQQRKLDSVALGELANETQPEVSLFDMGSSKLGRDGDAGRQSAKVKSAVRDRLLAKRKRQVE